MDRAGLVPSLFGVPRALIGVVHLGALPGTPRGERSVEQVAALGTTIFRNIGKLTLVTNKASGI